MIFLPFCVFTVTSFRRCTITAQKSCTFPLYFLNVIFAASSRCDSSMYFHKSTSSFVCLFFSLFLFVCPKTISRVSHNFFYICVLWNFYFLDSLWYSCVFSWSLIWFNKLSISPRFIGGSISDSVVTLLRLLVRNKSSTIFQAWLFSRENFASLKQSTIYEFNSPWKILVSFVQKSIK